MPPDADLRLSGSVQAMEARRGRHSIIDLPTCILAVRVGFTDLQLPFLSLSLLELLMLALKPFPAGNCPPAV